jgi:hypothetical protein
LPGHRNLVQLIACDQWRHTPWLGGSKDGVAMIATCFGFPRNFCHGPKEAASTARGKNRGKSLWNLAVGCKPLELGEQHVPKAVVLMHQLG